MTNENVRLLTKLLYFDERKRTFFLVIFEGLSGGFVLESRFFVLVKLSD